MKSLPFQPSATVLSPVITTCKFFVLLSLTVLSVSGKSRAALLIDYDFNQVPGSSVTNVATSGTSGNATMFNFAGAATDLHSANGGGVSGLSGDYAFDNSASVSMGGNGGRVAQTSVDAAVDGLMSFTLTGWFNSSSGDITNNARLYSNLSGSNTGFDLFAGTAGSLTLRVDNATGGTAVSTGTAYSGSGTWIFFAVSYDGTLTSNNVNFYVGNTSTAVSLVSTASINQGQVGDDTATLTLGNFNLAATQRAFDGLLDEFQIYGSKTDNTGVLNLSALEAVRLSAIPEPSTALLTLAGLALVARLRLRRPVGHF